MKLSPKQLKFVKARIIQAEQAMLNPPGNNPRITWCAIREACQLQLDLHNIQVKEEEDALKPIPKSELLDQI